MPAALFISHDDGASWEICNALDTHPTNVHWGPGAVGLMLHHISPRPR